MTSELEQEFFRVFGIEPKKLFSARQGINPDAVFYPEITDRMLLELICTLNKFHILNNGVGTSFIKYTIDDLKKEILNETKLFYRILLKIEKSQRAEELKDAVRAVFEGEE